MYKPKLYFKNLKKDKFYLLINNLNNKLFTCLLLNMLLMKIVIIIIYILLFIHFTDISLCDSTNLEELKDRLVSDTNRLNEVADEHKNYVHLFKEAQNRPEKHEDIIHYLYTKASGKYYIMKYYLTKIRLTEEGIKKMEPNFVSNIKKK
jgi:hypothetical protein